MCTLIFVLHTLQSISAALIRVKTIIPLPFFHSASPLTIILYLGINTATVQPDNMQLKTKIIKKLLVSA